MDIPPKVSFYLNIVYGIAVAISTGVLKFGGILTDKQTTAVVAYAGAAAFLLNLVLHGYSGPTPGPMSKSGKAMGVTLLSFFVLVFGLGIEINRAHAQIVFELPDAPMLLHENNFTPIPPPPVNYTALPSKRHQPQKLSPRKPGSAWINPSQFPIPLPPIHNPLAPTPVPTPKDPISAILNAVAQAQAFIVADLATAQAHATSPKSPQVASACVAPAVWIPAQAGTPAATGAIFNASIVGATLTVNSVASGALAIGQSITDAAGLVMPGTVITAGSGTTWTVNNIQTVLSDPMQVVTSPGVPAIAATCSPAEIWDPLGAACFPAMSDFVSTLPGPGALPTTPNGGGGLVTTAEDARILDFAVKQFAAQISTVGYPDSLKIACDPWMLDYVTQLNIDITKLAGLGLGIAGIPGVSGLMNVLLLGFIPKPIAAAHGLTGLQETLFHD